jgi:PAS domain S-box-containing protein
MPPPEPPLPSGKDRHDLGRHLLALAEATSDLVSTATARGELIYLNPAGRRLLGLPLEEPLEEVRVRELHPDWAWQRLEEIGFPTAAREGSWRGETAVLDDRGREIPVWQVITTHGGTPGEVRFISSIARDLTEWRRTREKLRERVKELRTLYDVTHFLSRWDEPLADRVQAVAERLPAGWLHPEFTEVRIRLHEIEVTTSGFRPTPWSLTAEIHSRKEPVGEVQVVLRSEPASPEGGDGPFLDEEEELLQGIARIIGDAVERERLQAEYLQVQKLETIGRLAGGTAHDFNNLLSVILGHADIALDSLPEESPVREDLLHLRRAAERGRTLTHQLLAFSRKQVLQERDCDLQDSVVEVEPMLRRLTPSRVELTIDPGQRPLQVRLDPGKLDQVVLNLVVNAIQAIPENGEIALILGARSLSPEEVVQFPWKAEAGDYAELVVRDTGVGMEPKTLDRIFEPFFTTKEEGEGTGLGLSMVFGFVKQSRGHIVAESTPGKGSTFRLLFPVRSEGSRGGEEQGESMPASPEGTEGGHHDATGGAPPAPGEDEGGSEERRRPGSTGTILLVEDEEAVRRVLTHSLEGR